MAVLTWSMFWIWSALVGLAGGAGTEWNNAIAEPGTVTTSVAAAASAATAAARTARLWRRNRRAFGRRLRHGSRQRLPSLRRQHVVDDDPGHRGPRLDRGARDVRRQHDVRQAEQALGHVRLVHEDVEPGADATREELVDERLLVDDAAACGVYVRRPVTEQR